METRNRRETVGWILYERNAFRTLKCSTRPPSYIRYGTTIHNFRTNAYGF